MLMLEELTPPQDEPADVQHLRKALMNAQRDLVKAKDRTEHLVEVTHAAAFDAMIALGKVPAVAPPKADKRKSTGEHALWVMTDWQGAKRTTTYNTEVVRQRVMLFTEKAIKITNMHRADHPVKDVTIAFGGDMVEGLFNFPTQCY